MRIVYTPDIFSRQSVGGISRYFVELIREFLVAERVDVELSQRWHINEHLRELQDTTELPGKFDPRLRVLRHVLPFLNSDFGLRSRTRTNSTAIVHHTYYSFSSPNGAACLIATAHDVMPELFWNRSHPRVKGLLLAKRRTLDAANRVIAVSEHTKRDIVNFYDLDPEVVDVIPHGNRMVSSTLDDVRGTSVVQRSKPYLLYVGARGGYKNWVTLVRAFAESRFLRREFEILCFGGGVFSRTEQELLATLGVSDSVSVTAGDDTALAAAYHGATAFVYPSCYEGFGLPPLEAMGCGCPVITSDAASIPEVVGGAGVYFDATDVDSIRSAIESTVESASKLSRLRQAGLDREKQFRWQRTAELTLLTYEKALQSDAIAPPSSRRAAA